MVGPLIFVACSTVFWLLVHLVFRCLWNGRIKREKEHRGDSYVKNALQQQALPGTTEEMPVSFHNNPQNKNRNISKSGKRSRRRASTVSEVKKATLNKLTSVIDKYNGEEWTWVDTKRYIVVSVLVCIVILHPTLTRQSLFLFMCVPIEESIVTPGNLSTVVVNAASVYLRKDVQLECYTPQHWTFALLVGLPGVIGYVIGTPLLTFLVLYRRKHKLLIVGPAGDETRKTYGFIYNGYSIYYWEVIIMSRKVSMVIVAVFGLRATVQTQALLALFVVLMASSAHIYAKPFDVRILDRLELYGLITAFITLYFGMFFFTKDAENSPFFLAVITIVILSTNFAFIIYWSIALYYALSEEVMLVKRFHIFASIKCHSCTHRYCAYSDKCMKLQRMFRKKWAAHHKNKNGKESDDDADDDDDEHFQVNRRRTQDHTVWKSMMGKGIVKDSLSSIHKNRRKHPKRHRNSHKHALEMVPIKRKEVFERSRAKMKKNLNENSINNQIRANKTATIFQQLGVHMETKSTNKMLPAPPLGSRRKSNIKAPHLPGPPQMPGPPPTRADLKSGTNRGEEKNSSPITGREKDIEMGELGLQVNGKLKRHSGRTTVMNTLFAKKNLVRDGGEDGVEMMEMEPKKNNVKDRRARLKQMRMTMRTRQHTTREEKDSDGEADEVCNPLFSAIAAKPLDNPLYKNKKRNKKK